MKTTLFPSFFPLLFVAVCLPISAKAESAISSGRLLSGNAADSFADFGIVFPAVLVTLMLLGLCMRGAGVSRARNATNLIMKIFAGATLAALIFSLFGFSLMFGAGKGNPVESFDFAFRPISESSSIWSFLLFQTSLVSVAAVIGAGAMAERTRFTGYLIFTAILAALLYPIFGQWAWGSFANGLSEQLSGEMGWLELLEPGFRDFAGGVVVHGIGGACALAGALVVGARKGRFGTRGKGRYLPGHNLPLFCFGSFLLWAGWFGFNTGNLVLSGEGGFARICTNTAIAGAAGGFTSMVVFRALRGVASVFATTNGFLGGLVASSACANVIGMPAAALIGIIAGVITLLGAGLLEKVRIDDVVGAVPVHLFCGIWGALSVSLFATTGVDFESFKTQAIGAFSITVSTFIVAWVLFKVIDLFGVLRVTGEDQEDGLDFTEHSVDSYPEFDEGG